jgi:hypothetical protein
VSVATPAIFTTNSTAARAKTWLHVDKQTGGCWKRRAKQAKAAKEAAELKGIAQAIRDMERLDKEAAREDVALLKRAEHPGNAVVHLN